MALHDFICLNCEYTEERQDGEKVICPNCGEEHLEKIWLKSPAVRVGGENSDRSIAAMQASFRKRFREKEMDDVLHQHGKEFEQSLVSGEANRIKKRLQK